MSNRYSIYVPPSGSRNAKIAVVGEGPGRDELAALEPFVGDAGGKLDKILFAVGINRSECFLTNATKYYPKYKKDKSEFFFSKEGVPTKAFMDGILELVAELREVKPNVVVALGNYALWALTQKWGIFEWRGSILESTLIPGLKVIPTIHPAWFIWSRAYHKTPLTEWDWQRIREESLTPEIVLPNPTFITSPIPEEIEDAIERYTDPSHEFITIDTEWYNPDSLAYIGFADSPDYAVVIPPSTMQAYRAYKTILSSSVPKAFQNAQFDAVALSRVGINVENIIHDSMLAWHNCYTDIREKRLSTICSVLTRWPFYKTDVEFVKGNDERGQEYCATDCVVQHESMEKILLEEFNISRGRKGYDISMSALNTFIRASKVGILADRNEIKRLRKKHLRNADRREYALSREVGYTINCRSGPQVASLVYDELGIRRKKRTTEQAVLMDIAASEHRPKIKKILTSIIRVRRDRNIVSRYVNEGIIDTDGRIRCNWNLGGTRNGRLSSTIPWWPGVAIQTVPEGARTCFVADPGHTFVGFDYEQAEARYVAIKTRDWGLLDAMQAGVDIHVQLAAQLPFNLTYEEIMALVREKGKDNVDQRVISKHTRHGMNYDMTWVGLKARINKDYLDTGVGIDAANAKLLRRSYLDLSEGLEWWWDEVIKKLRENDRFLRNCFGRERKFLGALTEHNHLHRDAIAFEPQSSIADLTTRSIVRLDENDWLTPLTHMHDGGFVQVLDKDVERTVDSMRVCMDETLIVDGHELVIPFEIKVGPNWGEMEKVA